MVRVYEFENWKGVVVGCHSGHQTFTDIADKPVVREEDTVIDLMHFYIDPEEEEKIKRSLVEKTKYKEGGDLGTEHRKVWIWSQEEALWGLGRCENIKSLKMYFPQMIVGVCHKNETLLLKENISKVHCL